MNREQLIKIASLYKEDIKNLDIGHDRDFTTVTVSNRNIEATFISDELDNNLVYEVLNHVIGIDYDDTDDDIFRVILPESLNFKVVEKITMMGNAATLTATADINGMDIELYSMFIVGSRRTIKFPEAVMVDNVSRFEVWVMPTLEYEDAQSAIAIKLSTITELSAKEFRDIKLLNGDTVEIESCITAVEKEGGELFCKIDIAKHKCIYGYNHYNVKKKVFEPCWVFHSKW